MIRSWNQLEGVSLAGFYLLEERLTASESDAWYRTRLSDGGTAAVRVLPDRCAASDGQIAVWQEAIGFDHPHIVRMLDAGRTEANGMPLLYAVCEFPDDFLAGVLRQRALS